MLDTLEHVRRSGRPGRASLGALLNIAVRRMPWEAFSLGETSTAVRASPAGRN
jgi:hypothetical protein